MKNNPSHSGRSPAKWFLVLDDRRLPAPRQHITENIIRAQGAVAPDKVIVRDHNSPDDEVILESAQIDLAKGNVFYTLARCDARLPASCFAPAKLAFSVDDKVEETVNRSQTGTTLLDLYGIERNVALFRDHESASDEPVKPDDALKFEHGPVFYTRSHCRSNGLTIIVNSRSFGPDAGVHQGMTARDVARLISDKPEEFDTYAGPIAQGQPLSPSEPLTLSDGDVFTVVKKEVVGGYSVERIEVELATLAAGGTEVLFIRQPSPAVIYRRLPVREGLGLNQTDVLVPVPSGYPGQHLDWAYLPDDSPLFGRVVGSPQDVRLTVDGGVWRQVSYHPHTGGGFPSWNPSVHGLHTYIDALIAWLARWK